MVRRISGGHEVLGAATTIKQNDGYVIELRRVRATAPS